ncbi:hypothetical protein [Paenibacillus fonticola]|uniref:hypothetical protein n=1 Tax=Paenibacillus fonticola TaxID=379896 RepID=UPI00037D678E|nr:hypothetical protein [Paenibacillus fonticola]
MKEVNEKQKELLKKLKQIRDQYVDFSVGSLEVDSKLNWSTYREEYIRLGSLLHSNKDKQSFREIQVELIDEVIYRILEMLDGYGGLTFEIEMMDKDTRQSITEGIQLHDKYMENTDT